ncbi:hypothetical protein PHISCL_05429 [Aspergillus sclerotialis]|uniref:INO80 complex subunit F domain-containing protein n=1 Tax=Aspergillus sclerotialis TaxID=2070753 RepID=A0A3A2ZI85_9EURO|nr:hypothetical protein PHISCL_05429 [Aspergillus sclerotialis]
MEPTAKPPTSIPSSNPPSVEVAYKRKSIALKKRLNEVESENELMRQRNQRGWKYVQKMRLESCILLERLAKVTGMAEEAQAGMNPELRARAAAMMSNASALNGIAAAGPGGETGNGAGGYFEDETEGSSDEQPPTPQERPLRVKRSRKSNANDVGDEDMPAPNNADNTNPNSNNNNNPDPSRTSSASLPRLAPAPSQEEMTSSFRIQTGSNGSASHEHNRDANPTPGFGYPLQEQQHNNHPYPYHSGMSHVQHAPEPAPTPMDVDSKNLKEES